MERKLIGRFRDQKIEGKVTVAISKLCINVTQKPQGWQKLNSNMREMFPKIGLKIDNG